MKLKRWKILWVYSFWCSPISFRISLYLSICMCARWPLLSYLSLLIPLPSLLPHPSKLRSPMTAFIPEPQIVGSSESVPGAEHKMGVTQMSFLPSRVWESRKHIDTNVIITPSSLDMGHVGTDPSATSTHSKRIGLAENAQKAFLKRCHEATWMPFSVMIVGGGENITKWPDSHFSSTFWRLKSYSQALFQT